MPILALGGLVASLAIIAHPKNQPTMATSQTSPEQPHGTVKKSDADWRRQLTPEQYRVARQAGTEPPNGEVYKQFKQQGTGTYYCVCCNAELFSSTEKFDSGCGWPSFFDPSTADNVKTLPDPDGTRTEVRCKVCDAHLGHVFAGEGFNTPTDQRYCINGIVLKFVPRRL